MLQLMKSTTNAAQNIHLFCQI